MGELPESHLGGVGLDAISVVIPALNEEAAISGTLSSLRLSPGDELLVVDGGSTDRTVDIARLFTDKVIISKPGRAIQMNLGASRASADILLFLHADCIMPASGMDLIRNTIGDGSCIAGAFDIEIRHRAFSFRVIEALANLRSRLTSVPYGDQALFMRRETFKRIGGFMDIPLMEDIELGRRLKRMGRVAFLRPPVEASARRWLKEGVAYTTLRDWALAFSYTVLGVSPEKLVRHYANVR